MKWVNGIHQLKKQSFLCIWYADFASMEFIVIFSPFFQRWPRLHLSNITFIIHVKEFKNLQTAARICG